jgi:hypothetical protein
MQRNDKDNSPIDGAGWNPERINARISGIFKILEVKKRIGEERFREIVEEQKTGPAYRTIAQGVSREEMNSDSLGEMEPVSPEEADKPLANQIEEGEGRRLEPIRKFSDSEILKLQNNIYKLYIAVKSLERIGELSLRDLKMLTDFGHCYIFDPDNSYDDEDFTLICNIEDGWIDGDGEAYLKTLLPERREAERMRFYEEDKKLVLESLRNISGRYFKLKFLLRLDIEGTVMYGRYASQKILITRDKEYDIFYSIYLWYEDNIEDREELFAKTRAEVRDFFRCNEVVVKWEEENKNKGS